MPPTTTYVLTPLSTPYAIPVIVDAGKLLVATHAALLSALASKYAASTDPLPEIATNLAAVSSTDIVGVLV